MKMNFKYLMLVGALLAGFSSCSNDDEVTDGIVPNGAKTVARFSLNQTGTTRAGVASAGASDVEQVIKTAVLYVFDSGQNLEEIVEFNSATSQLVEISSGTHYFLAAVNAPAISGIAKGQTMSSVESTIAALTSGMGDITDDADDAATAIKGFFMTNINGATSQVLDPNKTKEAPNQVTVNVGRAMAKINVSCVDGDDTDALSGNGKLTGIQYLTANNPKEMYLFPVVSNGLYTSPYFNDYVDSYAATTAEVEKKYFPAIPVDGSGLTFTSVYDGSDESASASYLVENANKKPRKGTSNYILLKGKYEPAAWVNGNNESASADGNGTFWRLYSHTKKIYYNGYINATDATDINITKFTADDITVYDIVAVKYENGVCYYAFYLKNANNVTDSPYTVKRNVYYDVTLNNVVSAGSSVPNIEGDYPIPGTGGGDGGEGGKDPIDENTFVVGTINILSWNVVDQAGGIGY